jgi:hypothetical protein
MFKQIIVAVDGSEHSNRALKYAGRLAGSFKATVWLVHAFPQTTDLLAYEDFEKLISRRKAAGQAVLDDARERLGETGFEVQEELLHASFMNCYLLVDLCKRSHERQGQTALPFLVRKSIMLLSLCKTENPEFFTIPKQICTSPT